MINFRNTVFIKSAPDYKDAPEKVMGEILFVGRSNAGKSSLINAICDHSSLAFTSSKHTRDAQTQQESIERRALNLQNRVQREAQTLDEENVVFTNRMQDLLLRAVQEINADKKYKMVVNASALLDADMALDITDAVLAKFNELYAAEKAEKNAK